MQNFHVSLALHCTPRHTRGRGGGGKENETGRGTPTRMERRPDGRKLLAERTARTSQHPSCPSVLRHDMCNKEGLIQAYCPDRRFDCTVFLHNVKEHVATILRSQARAQVVYKFSGHFIGKGNLEFLKQGGIGRRNECHGCTHTNMLFQRPPLLPTGSRTRHVGIEQSDGTLTYLSHDTSAYEASTI